jgi:hypothetical protein
MRKNDIGEKELMSVGGIDGDGSQNRNMREEEEEVHS